MHVQKKNKGEEQQALFARRRGRHWRVKPRAQASVNTESEAVRVEISLCVPEDQKAYLPQREGLPTTIASHDRPNVGDVLRLGPSSLWAVAVVVHNWPTPHQHRIEVWLERVVSRHLERPAGFTLRQ